MKLPPPGLGRRIELRRGNGNREVRRRGIAPTRNARCRTGQEVDGGERRDPCRIAQGTIDAASLSAIGAQRKAPLRRRAARISAGISAIRAKYVNDVWSSSRKPCSHPCRVFSGTPKVLENSARVRRKRWAKQLHGDNAAAGAWRGREGAVGCAARSSRAQRPDCPRIWRAMSSSVIASIAAQSVAEIASATIFSVTFTTANAAPLLRLLLDRSPAPRDDRPRVQTIRGL